MWEGRRLSRPSQQGLLQGDVRFRPLPSAQPYASSCPGCGLRYDSQQLTGPPWALMAGLRATSVCILGPAWASQPRISWVGGGVPPQHTFNSLHACIPRGSHRWARQYIFLQIRFFHQHRFNAVDFCFMASAAKPQVSPRGERPAYIITSSPNPFILRPSEGRPLIEHRVMTMLKPGRDSYVLLQLFLQEQLAPFPSCHPTLIPETSALRFPEPGTTGQLLRLIRHALQRSFGEREKRT